MFEHQPNADLPTRTLGDVEQATTMHWHGDADATHHTCVTMEKMMPASNSNDTADTINFNPGNTNT